MIIQHPAILDQSLNKELMEIASEIGVSADMGMTMCTYDFYEGRI